MPLAVPRPEPAGPVPGREAALEELLLASIAAENPAAMRLPRAHR